jgi:hypothetical protein
MKLKEYTFKEGNYFIAMQYYGLILNRTFLVLLHKNKLIGLKVNGLVSAPGGSDPITLAITESMSIKDNPYNPFSYVKNKYLRRLEDIDIEHEEILNVSPSNFKIDKNDIIEVRHNKNKKWGMGPYPHDGRIYIKTRNRKRKELIILGNQSGQQISDWINKK